VRSKVGVAGYSQIRQPRDELDSSRGFFCAGKRADVCHCLRNIDGRLHLQIALLASHRSLSLTASSAFPVRSNQTMRRKQ
jgi:hypothetical protein